MHRKQIVTRHESDKRYGKDRLVDFPANFQTGYAKKGSPISHKRSFNRHSQQENLHSNMGQNSSAPSPNSRGYSEYIDLNSARPAKERASQAVDRQSSLYDPQLHDHSNRDRSVVEGGPLRFKDVPSYSGQASDVSHRDNQSFGGAREQVVSYRDVVGSARQHPEQYQPSGSIKDSQNSLNEYADQYHPTIVPMYKVDDFIGIEDPFALDNNIFPVETPSEPAVASTFFAQIAAPQFQRKVISVHRNVNPENLIGRGRAVTNALQDRTQWMNTSRNTRTKLPQFQEHAELIVRKMEDDILLMADSPNGEQLRRDALRDMPQCLTVKRQIKQKLSRSLSQKSKSKSIGCFKNLRYRVSFAFSKFWDGFNDLQYNFEWWYSTLRNIEGHFGSGVATHFKFFRWLFIMNVLLSIPCLAFLILPHLLYEHLDDERASVMFNNASFSFEDIFTGEGFFSNTLLYYGFYPNITIELVTHLPYNLSAAYFFTMLAQFVMFFLILSISMARSYRKNFIETKGGLENIYAHKIFCGWDFGIANENSAELKHSSIYNELKEILEDTSRHYMRTPFLLKFWNRCIQFSVHMIVLFIYAGIGYSLWYLLDSYRDNEEDTFNIAVVTAILINVIMMVMPAIFTYIMRFEGYKSPRTALYITLFRIFLLGATVIGVLLMYWMTKASDEPCWETSFGQEIYRLVIFDFIFCVIFMALISFARGMLQMYYCKIGIFEFSIALYTMNLIYNQTLFWVGIYFAPLLSIIIVIKLYLTWYIRSRILLNFTRPSSKSWRAAQTHTWFLIFTFLSLLLVLGSLGFMMVQTKTSQCGPFKNYEFVYEIIQNILDVGSEHVIWKLLSFIVKPGVVFFILLFMCLSIYYLRAKTLAQVDMVYILREMLINEAKDKEFLLNQISRVSKGKWQYNAFEQRSIGMNPAKLLPNFQKIGQPNGNKNYNEVSDSANEDSQGLLHNNSGTSLHHEESEAHKKYD